MNKSWNDKDYSKLQRGGHQEMYCNWAISDRATPIFRILMNKDPSRNRLEIMEEQCSFVQDSGIRNAMFMIRMSNKNAERSILIGS